MLKPALSRSVWVGRYLDNWKHWMQQGGLPDAISDHASGGARNATSYDRESCDAAYARQDVNDARMTDSILDDLSPVERAAIYSEYLAAVFRFRDRDAVLARALGKIQVSLARKGIYLG